MGSETPLGPDLICLGAPDDLAHCTFGHDPDELLRSAGVEEILSCVFDLPQNRESDIHDVLVTGQYQTFVGTCTDAEIELTYRLDLRCFDCFDRPQNEVQSGVCRTVVLAKAEHHALLIGFNSVDRIHNPNDSQADENDQKHHWVGPAAARNKSSQQVTTSFQEIFQIQRGVPPAAGPTGIVIS